MSKEKDLKKLIENDVEFMEVLSIIEELNLSDCWLCAGSIRNYVWNYLSGKKLNFISDIDVIYYDKNSDYQKALEIEKELNQHYPNHEWEVRNQAHMHAHNFSDEKPYESSFDAISKYPEICTAVAVKKNENSIEIMAPYGLEDIFSFQVKATPHFNQDERYFNIYLQRVAKKNWKSTWKNLNVITNY